MMYYERICRYKAKDFTLLEVFIPTLTIKTFRVVFHKEYIYKDTQLQVSK